MSKTKQPGLAMESRQEDQLDKLIEDIQAIKAVLSENAPMLRQIMLPVHFRFLSILAGLVTLFFVLPGPLAISLTLGCGLILFALIPGREA
ncbi:MAG: hypothetical protein ABIK68_05740 [bacterium]